MSREKLSLGAAGDESRPFRIRTFYPADPLGVVPGGVDTFIRGILKWAPVDLSFQLVGMTTDAEARPLGRWTRCELGRRTFDMFPVVSVADAGKRTRWPLSLRFTAGVLRAGQALRTEFDAFEFHRIEPALLFLGDPRPKCAFFHQDMGVIRSEQQADILWKHAPGVYFAMEHRVVRGLDAAWCVREEGAAALRRRNADSRASIEFVPTWVDPEVFAPLLPDERRARRADFAARQRLDASPPWVVSVGRLDTQKDPMLMLAAVARLHAAGRPVKWLVVGDGVLRQQLAMAVQREGLADSVHFLGLMRPTDIASLLAVADLFALSSAYEGMPMAILEALACGLPAVSTDVGEVRRVVLKDVNGAIAEARTPECFAAAMAICLDRLADYRGQPAHDAIKAYHPSKVLAPVFDAYRRMAARSRSFATPVPQ